MSPSPEFSRPVPLMRLGTEPFHREISATIAERAALARRFDLVSLDRLEAVVELVRQDERTVLLRAQFEAAFEQICTITLDPIASAIAAEFSLLYGAPDAEEAAAGLVGDEVAFEPLPSEAIDIGEAVAQEFSLALPPFPRSPDAAIEIEAPAADDGGPFAALSRLRDRDGGGLQ
jgi:uncharacterized metal-binding protein YceD (DUF177 family)